MNGVTYITDDKGVRLSAVVPIELFERLINHPGDCELREQLQDDTGKGVDTLYPHEVVGIMAEKQVSLIAAWRMYRNLTQSDVANIIGVKQSTIAQMERSSNPRAETLSKLAEVYRCSPEQLVLD